jgi:hypothetical protein
MPVIAEAEKGYGPLPESISGVTYKIIPSWPDYAAGSDGTIWSKRKKKDCHRPSRWHRLSPSPNTWGYLLVVVNRLGARKTRTVHRLVAEAFHGECPDGMEVRHFDGNQLNNAPSNLAYGTKSENALDRSVHGRHPGAQGERNPKAKLTGDEVAEIRRIANQGVTCREILQTGRFPVSLCTIQRIVSGKLWYDAAVLCQRLRQDTAT